ncbi:hypothetical protein BVC80_1395g131 [Macleaya cordata]|uniref:Uncharacterized protein n=1 Tax=Macleaya cordata TaxID=56857 RepID=A0A200Q1Q8_MACCD|nr:hypothetical protein BVC80_1395g131 [Macleaya cordata]
MGTEVLRPQDCLIERLRVGPTTVIPRRKSYIANSNPKPNRKTVIRPEPKKRFPQSEPSTTADVSRSAKNNLTIGQVTILKRGESLDINSKNDNFSMKRTDLIVCGSERLGPNPEMVPKQIRITDLKSVRSEVYAGSAFYMSPSPSALPLPTFSMKKEGLAIVDDSATKDLRRLLRLD